MMSDYTQYKKFHFDIEHLEIGMYAMYKGTWAYVCGKDVERNIVLLSGWHGCKTTTVEAKNITTLKYGVEFSR